MPRQAAQPGKKLLTSEEVKRALFIDYEGSKSRKFQATLLGIMADRVLTARIVEPLFAKSCSERFRAKYASGADHVKVAIELLRRAENEDRVVVSWSQHDYKLMIEALNGHVKQQDVLRRRFRNAIHTSKRWEPPVLADPRKAGAGHRPVEAALPLGGDEPLLGGPGWRRVVCRV